MITPVTLSPSCFSFAFCSKDWPFWPWIDQVHVPSTFLSSAAFAGSAAATNASTARDEKHFHERGCIAILRKRCERGEPSQARHGRARTSDFTCPNGFPQRLFRRAIFQ